MNAVFPERRKFLGVLAAAGITSLSLPCPALSRLNSLSAPVRLGIIADLHGGLADDADQRLDAFLEVMRQQKPDALVQLGDFAYPNRAHQAYSDRFNAAHENTIHVIGNHEFDHGLEREDCFRAWGIDASYYRTDVGAFRILVLDGNEKGSPSDAGGYPSFIGDEQLRWLDGELRTADRPVVILSHQPLAGVWAIDNAETIQELLAKHADRIVICLNGHSHVDSLHRIAGVRYLHINSASYFWVGGETRMAYYRDPLFTTLTIDPGTCTVTVAARSTTWRGKSPDEIGYFEGKTSPPKAIVTPQIRARKIVRTQIPLDEGRK